MLHLLLFCLLLAPVLVVPVGSLDPTLNDDVLGLIVFKAGLQDPEAKLQSWTEDDYSPCGWDGVTCDQRTNRVTHLRLNGFSLSGHIGRGLLRLQFLQILSLSNNNFSGSISPVLAHLWSLQVIDLSENNLSGSIPYELFQQCGSLKSVSFARNNLTGQIPVSLSSCSTLQAVNFSYNQISGQIYSALWYLRGMESIDLSNNLLDGEIPEGIGSLYNLRLINLGKNRLSGRIPWDIGGCFVLESLDFSENYLSGDLPESMQRLGSLSSLILQGNSLTGQIPHWIGELTTIETLDFSANRFSGWIPESLGNLTVLKELNLSMNRLAGDLPSWIFERELQNVVLSENRMRGRLGYPSVASTAAFNRGLYVLDLSANAFSGEISHNIGFLGSLMSLNLSKNQLLGSIPTSIGKLKSTNVLDLSDNRLNGSIPSEIGGAVSLKELRLEKNFLSGKIPTQLKNCSSLTTLILSENKLTGPVPAAIANLSNLQFVDFSFNNLTGSLPKELTNLSHLLLFNVSHNHLRGELPLGGYFNTISPSSVSGNPSLCGSVVKRACPSVHPKPIVLNPNSSASSNGSSSLFNHRRRKIVLSISALIAIGAAAFIVVGVVSVTVLNIHFRSSMSHSAALPALSNGDDFSCSPANDPNYGKLVMFTGDAEFVAGDHALLNKDCELGRGGFGIAYRTILRDGRSVAVKKLTVSSLTKSQEDFEREVKHLGKIRHHNLVGLEGYYWTPSLQLLIYEYISSGSLYRHLHDGPGRNCLTWRQRFRIILGMAKGLAHLHQLKLIHYNLKSTNVLIDDTGEAKVGDFGLARLLPMLDRCILSSKIQSALGYMAPEFACRTVKITEKCDVYGFGILVLEVLTGKRPVEYMDDDVVILCDMVRRALEDGRLEECVDERLRRNFPADEAIPVIKLGLICASQVPSNRPDMEEVVNILELIQCSSEGQEEME